LQVGFYPEDLFDFKPVVVAPEYPDDRLYTFIDLHNPGRTTNLLDSVISVKLRQNQDCSASNQQS
jgi:hypothetical protein